MTDEALIREWCERVSGCPEDNLFVRRLQQFLSTHHLARVLQVMKETCPECFDSPRGCPCWNDE